VHTYNIDNMKKLLLTGLAALIIGTSYDTGSKKQDYGFIAKEYNYSLKNAPESYGVVYFRHGTDGTSYGDLFVSENGQINIECLKQEGNLQELYKAYSKDCMKGASEYLLTRLAFGQALDVTIYKPKKLRVDGNHALQGKTELKIFSGDIYDMTYAEKFTLMMTVSESHGNVHRFTLFYEQDGKENPAKKFYEEVLDGYKDLK
jgi:hypothetical protein